MWCLCMYVEVMFYLDVYLLKVLYVCGGGGEVKVLY